MAEALNTTYTASNVTGLNPIKRIKLLGVETASA
jgi:hypothetical protein